MDFTALFATELEGIMSPCYLLIGQYPHHVTLCPPVAIVKRRYGIHLYRRTAPWRKCKIIKWHPTFSRSWVSTLVRMIWLCACIFTCLNSGRGVVALPVGVSPSLLLVVASMI